MKTSSIAVETSRSTSQSDSIVRQTNKRSFLSYTTMNNIHIFNDIELKYGRTALRLIRRHERCSRKLARFSNHLTFLTRCIKSHIIPRDLRVQPPVPTKGARREAELASKRFLRERIRLTQKAKGDAKRETESTAEGITATLMANEASEILEKILIPKEYSMPPKIDNNASS